MLGTEEEEKKERHSRVIKTTVKISRSSRSRDILRSVTIISLIISSCLLMRTNGWKKNCAAMHRGYSALRRLARGQIRQQYRADNGEQRENRLRSTRGTLHTKLT